MTWLKWIALAADLTAFMARTYGIEDDELARELAAGLVLKELQNHTQPLDALAETARG